MAQSGPPAWARAFYILLGIVLFVTGLLWAWSPVPFGFVLMGIGLAILLWASRVIRRLVRRWRTKSRSLDRALTGIENGLPKRWTENIKRTRPDNHDDDEEDGEENGEGGGRTR